MHAGGPAREGEERSAPDASTTSDGGRLTCPFCGSYDVDRLFLASARVDCCSCAHCGARYDEDPTTGAYRGRGDRASVLMPRSH